MAEIALSNGYAALVSPEDEAVARAHRWHGCKVDGGKIYAMRAARTGGRHGKSTTYYLHRLIANAAPGQIVDHINGDSLDNRRENLRLADASLNCVNRRSYSPASGFRGVYASGRRWKAALTARGVDHKLGVFERVEDAARAYDAAAIQAFGDFAVLNFERA